MLTLVRSCCQTA